MWEKIISNYLYGAGNIMLNVTREVVQRHEDESVQAELNYGAGILIQALYKVNVEDDVIISLVQKYYGFSERESEELMSPERTIIIPCQKLETFLVRSEGYTRDEAVNFILKNGIPDFFERKESSLKFITMELF